MSANPYLEPVDKPELAISKEKLVLLPFYHELENEVKQSDRVRIQTDYFWRKWAPKLGPTLTVLVVILRSYCYYNKLTKERRDWCFPEQKTLAGNAGVSIDTIQRELKRPIAAKFVRREPRYRYDPVGKRKIRTADMYYVAMDDPLTPEDEAEIAEKVSSKLAEDDSPATKPQLAVQDNPPVDNLASKPQSAAQNATADSYDLTSTSKKDFRTFAKQIYRPLSVKEESIVQEILSVCQDEHSRRFYESTARTLPSQRIWAALSEVKDAAATGRLKKSKGAFFTAILKSRRED